MRAAANTYGWNLNYGGIALMWRGGCIIRSVFLGKIKEAFERDPDLVNLMLDPFFADQLAAAQDGWRQGMRVGGEKRRAGSGVYFSAALITTATAARGYLPICCRRSAITLARIPTSASTRLAGSSSTPTGRARAATPPRAFTTPDVSRQRERARGDTKDPFESIARYSPNRTSAPAHGHARNLGGCCLALRRFRLENAFFICYNHMWQNMKGVRIVETLDRFAAGAGAFVPVPGACGGGAAAHGGRPSGGRIHG